MAQSPIISRQGAPTPGRMAPLIAMLTAFAAVFQPQPMQQRDTRWIICALITIALVGSVLRLWGLDAVGLHGDEETMAMPTMHIVEHGTPVFPSGMFYGRAISQLYLMAGSVMLFGESEWVFRLPSVLCGILLILLAYGVGKRFLSPVWNLAFAAAVAFLPAFIEDAQTARMYAFLVASVAGFLILLFEWERTERMAYLMGAVLVLAVGVQFQSLAIFSAPLLLYPGLLHGDSRRLVKGVVATIAAGVLFLAIDGWAQQFYPDPPVSLPALEGVVNEGAKAASMIPQVALWVYAAASALALLLSGFVVARVRPLGARVTAGVCLALGLIAQLAYWYHFALLLLAFGVALTLRCSIDRLPWKRLAVLAVISASLALAHVITLQQAGVESIRQLFGALVGQPSLWPFIVVREYSMLAALSVPIIAGFALIRYASRKPVPDFVLFMLIGIWAPLFLIGFFKWYIPARYAEGVALPLLLCTFALAQWMMGVLQAKRVVEPRSHRRTAAAAAMVCIVVVNPLSVARTVGAGYATHPDHKGAAEFMKAQTLAPDDIVVAEDVLQQTYYLGRVDYWLIGKHIAAEYVHEVDGKFLDNYTNTPFVGTGEELMQLVNRRDRGAIYVIGSGEGQEDGRRGARGYGIFEALQSSAFQSVFEGRDRLTKIWKVSEPPQD